MCKAGCAHGCAVLKDARVKTFAPVSIDTRDDAQRARLVLGYMEGAAAYINVWRKRPTGTLPAIASREVEAAIKTVREYLRNMGEV
jgi:hypothetical protein